MNGLVISMLCEPLLQLFNGTFIGFFSVFYLFLNYMVSGIQISLLKEKPVKAKVLFQRKFGMWKLNVLYYINGKFGLWKVIVFCFY